MVAVWRMVLSRCGLVLLCLLAGCGASRHELWSDPAAVADQIPTFRQVSPPDLHALALAPGARALVAVGDAGAILRSLDNGAHWTRIAHGGTVSTLLHVFATPGGALFAVGESGAIVTSRDGGASWSAIASTGTKQHLRFAIALSNDILVAFGDGGAVVRSIDGGASWFPAFTNVTSTLHHAVAVDGRRLLAVGDSGYMIRSDDAGENWVRIDSSAGMLVAVLSTRGGALIAVGDGIVRAATIDGQWAPVDLPGGGPDPQARFSQVIAAPGGQLLAISPRRTLTSSDDGKTWIPAGAISGMELAFPRAEGGFAVLGESQAASSEGIGWQMAAVPSAMASWLAAIVAPDGSLVAAGRAGALWQSRDGGATWLAVAPAGRADTLLSVAEGVNGVLVAVGDRGAIMRSTDSGVSWVGVASGTDAQLRHVLAQPGGRWVVAGQLGTILQSTSGGATWALAHTPAENNNELHRLIRAGPDGNLVAVGAGATILRSVNGGLDWTPVPAASGHGLADLALQRDVLVAVGDEGTIVRSTDYGASWKPAANSGTDRALARVVATRNALIACSVGGLIVRSTDLGINWTPVDTPVGDNLEDLVVARNDVLLAMGTHIGVDPGQSIVRSTDDGVTWTRVATPALGGSGLGRIVAGPDGVLYVLGGKMLRSVDDGASWSVVSGTFKTGTNDAVTTQDGHFVAAGDNGLIVRDAARQPAPTIRRILHSYDYAGHPVLRISVDDPARLCPGGACLAAFGRSALDAKNGVAARKLPPAALSPAGTPGEYDLAIDPAVLGTAAPAPLSVSLEVDVPGHHRVYRLPSGADFTVENDPTPVWKATWFQVVATAAAALLLLTLIAAIKPLWLLPLMARQETLLGHSVGGLAGTVLTLIIRLLLPLLSRQPMVLNAWVHQHGERLDLAFGQAARRVSDRSAYWALPVTGPDGRRIIPAPATLAEFFKQKRACIEIVGQGGAGKTRLALQLQVWLSAGRLTPHPATALFIDEDFTDLFAVVKAKLAAELADAAPSDAFLKALLTNGRLWLFIDRVSERLPATRAAVARIYQAVTPKVLICTSRLPVVVDGAHNITLRPDPLDRDTLLDFVLLQLREADARALFPDPGALVQFIYRMAPSAPGGGMPRVVPLLATLVVAQAIASARSDGAATLNNLPRNLPEVYFMYVQKLDESRQDAPSSPGMTPAALIRLAATVIARAELGDDFRPGPVDATLVHDALMADTRISATRIDFIDRFDQNGLLARRTVATDTTVEFILDPLAECLGAYAHARRCGADPAQWHALLQRVLALGDAAQGFMMALRMNHDAYAAEFGFPAVAFPASG